MNECRGDRQKKALKRKVERKEGRTTGLLTGQKVCFVHLLCLLSMWDHPLWWPQSHCMSGVHLFCIKVSGKDAMGVSRLACSSLKGYRQRRAQGGRDMADNCIFYWGSGCSCTAGWHNTARSQSKPAQNNQRQSTWGLWMPRCVKQLCVSKLLCRFLASLYWHEKDRGQSNIVGLLLKIAV